VDVQAVYYSANEYAIHDTEEETQTLYVSHGI
jgi:hypothetical protein